MAYVKVPGAWPAVLPDDDGIRPAGPPDRCFYCGRRVGAPHAADCVTVYQSVRYDVLVGGAVVGTYDLMEPHAWDDGIMTLVRNDGSWCADDALDEIAWDAAAMPDPDAALARYKAATRSRCSCGWLEFRVARVLDRGPFVERPGNPG